MANIIYLLKEAPRVADLLITMAVAAVNCKLPERRRHLLALNPPRSCFIKAEKARLMPKGPARWLLRYQSSQLVDWEGLKEALNAIPSVAELNLCLQSKNGLQLKEYLDAKDSRLFPCLDWIFNSYYGQIVEVKSLKLRELLLKKDAKRGVGVHVFLVKPNKLNRSWAFEKVKKTAAQVAVVQSGSSFMFHASPFYNFHSILRLELKNAMGTALQAFGAMHGSGLYLSRNLDNVSQFSEKSNAWCNSEFSSQIACLALCKVHAEDAVQSIKPVGDVSIGHILATDERDVVVKCLIVCDGLQANDNIPLDATKAPKKLGKRFEATAEYQRLLEMRPWDLLSPEARPAGM
eukprot:jgi/Botrbrau1/10375/Bobra.146_2s0013.1